MKTRDKNYIVNNFKNYFCEEIIFLLFLLLFYYRRTASISISREFCLLGICSSKLEFKKIMEINGRTNDSVFIVRVEWKGRISFSLNLVCMEKFYASLTGIENTKRRRV